MGLTALAGNNQQMSLAEGQWLWRAISVTDVAGDAIGEHIIFDLEKNNVVLDYQLHVLTTTAAAGTALPQVKNSGGDVGLVGAGHSLTAAAKFVYNRTTAPGTTTDQAPTKFVLEVAALTANASFTALVGVFVARIDLDPT